MKTRNGGELNDDDDDDDDEFYDAPRAKEGNVAGVSVDFDDDDDDGIGVLEAMVAGHKSRKPPRVNVQPKASVASAQVENENDWFGPTEYDNRKSTRKKRGAKKEKGRKIWEESHVAAVNGDDGDEENDKTNGNDGSYAQEYESNGKENEHAGKDNKASNQLADKNGTARDIKSKAKTTPKGRKVKVTSKNLGNICETCREEFESGNKLHKHLGDAGRATIKGKKRKLQ